MKKALLTLIIALAGLSAWAGNQTGKVQNLVRQFKDCEGFEVVSLGRLGTSLMKGVIRLSVDMDDEDRAALNVFTNIKSLSIVDFEDAHPGDKERFVKKLGKILDGMELIMEVSDDGDHVCFYGIEDGSKVRDCIMYSSDGCLILTEGSIDFDKLTSLMEIQQ